MSKHENDPSATMPAELWRGLQELGPFVPTDAHFWQDFARDVRNQVYAVQGARQRRRWWLGASMTVAIAVAATLLLLWNQNRSRAPLAGVTPAVPGEVWTDFLGRGNVEELDAAAAEIFLDDTDPGEDVPADDDRFATDTAERTLDELSNPEIERVLRALNKGA